MYLRLGITLYQLHYQEQVPLKMACGLQSYIWDGDSCSCYSYIYISIPFKLGLPINGLRNSEHQMHEVIAILTYRWRILTTLLHSCFFFHLLFYTAIGQLLWTRASREDWMIKNPLSLSTYIHMFMYKKVAAAPTPTSGVNLKLLLFRRKSPLQNHLFRTKKVQFCHKLR